MDARALLGVFVGAGIGGLLRYTIGGWIAERAGPAFPWGTLVVNVAGAFLLGVLMALSVERDLVPPSARMLIGVGLLGGFTTFSTLSYESVALIQNGSVAHGLANMFGSAVLGLVSVSLGLLCGRLI